MQLALKSCALKHALTIAAVSQQAVMRLVIEMVFNKHSGLHDDTSLISMHICSFVAYTYLCTKLDAWEQH